VALSEQLLEWGSELESQPGTVADKLAEVCRRLQAGCDRFDWVGFYVADDASQLLRLGPFAGEPTQHTRIPYGRGICGQVAESGQTYVARDVREEANYIACSLRVRSEIVVPILYQGRFVAQLDIDSHTPDAFDAGTLQTLEQLCRILAPLFRPRHVYVHGLSSSPQSKKGLVMADGLASRGHVLLRPDMNLPSFEQLTLTAQVEALERLAAELCGPLTLVGSSLGGLVSLIFASRHPDRVRRLLLIAPAFKVVGHRLASMAGTTLSEWQRQGHIEMVHYADNRMHRLGYQLVQDANGFDFESLSPAMPTLIVHGTQDEVIPVDTVRAWAARRNGVRLVELPGGDHSLQTCFDLLWQESREFLEE